MDRIDNNFNDDEKIFYALFESVKDCVFVLSKTGIIFGVNKNGLSKLGCAEKDVIGKNIREFTVFESSEEFRKIVSKLSYENHYALESFMKAAANDKIPVEIIFNAAAISGNEIILAVYRDISLRKEIESMFERRESKYKAILEACPEGFLMLDTGGKILDTNAAYALQSGYSRDELLTMNYDDLLFSGSVESRYKILKNDRLLFENPHKTKTGAIMPVQVKANYWDNDGGQDLVFLFITNTSEHLQLLNQIQKEKQNMKNLLSAITNLDSTGVMIVKPDERMYYANEFICKTLGYPKQEMENLAPDKFIYADDLEIGLENAMKVYKGLMPSDVTRRRYIRKDGSVIIADVSVTRQVDNHGEAFVIVQYENIKDYSQNEKTG